MFVCWVGGGCHKRNTKLCTLSVGAFLACRLIVTEAKQCHHRRLKGQSCYTIVISLVAETNTWHKHCHLALSNSGVGSYLLLLVLKHEQAGG